MCTVWSALYVTHVVVVVVYVGLVWDECIATECGGVGNVPPAYIDTVNNMMSKKCTLQYKNNTCKQYCKQYLQTILVNNTCKQYL